MIKERIKERMEILGFFYDFDEVFGHLTAFDSNNEKALEGLAEDDLDLSIENACNIIDLNNEECDEEGQK